MYSTPMDALVSQVDQWRSYVRHRQAMHGVGMARLEDHVRAQVAGLVGAGLGTDEAFLLAVTRMGTLDARVRIRLIVSHVTRLAS